MTSLSIVCFVFGLLMLAASWRLQRQTQALLDDAERIICDGNTDTPRKTPSSRYEFLDEWEPWGTRVAGTLVGKTPKRKLVLWLRAMYEATGEGVYWPVKRICAALEMTPEEALPLLTQLHEEDCELEHHRDDSGVDLYIANAANMSMEWDR